MLESVGRLLFVVSLGQHDSRSRPRFLVSIRVSNGRDQDGRSIANGS